MKKFFLSLVILAVLGTALAVGLHFVAKASVVAMPAPPAHPPMPVLVKTLSNEKTVIWSGYSGRLTAVDYAEIRPEVHGRITEVRFEDGQSVKAGDVLFVIDPRPYQAAVMRSEANLNTAKSKVELAKIDLDRANSLIASHAIAQSELDRVMDEQRVAAASQEAAEAELAQAKLDLEHAFVTAPISGRVSHVEITVGNLVQEGPTAPLLTTIVSNDGIYADFEVDEQTYLQTIRNAARGNDQERRIPVELTVQGDKDHVYSGFIRAFDNRIDPGSGTIRARAKFANEDQSLVPGMFVSVRLAGSIERTALLVPERAIGSDQSKRFVYVVGADNKVAYREVELGEQVLAQRVVLKGLQPGERIIVDGVQMVRPNDVVDAKDVAIDQAAAATTRVTKS
jgi:multidrug efflux system membrane fusion protein